MAAIYYVLRPPNDDKPDPQLADIYVALKHMNLLLEAQLSGDTELKAGMLVGVIRESRMQPEPDGTIRSTVTPISEVAQAAAERESELIHQQSHRNLDRENEKIDAAFQLWWLRGRLVIMLIFLLTVFSVFYLLAIIYSFYMRFSIPSDFSCGGGENFGRLEAGIVSVVFASFIAIYLLV